MVSFSNTLSNNADQRSPMFAAVRELGGCLVVATVSPAAPMRSTLLAGLVAALAMQFRSRRDARDLDEAIALGAQLRADGARPDELAALGVALRLRAEVTGRTEDLDEAVRIARKVVSVSTTTPNWPTRPWRCPSRSAGERRRSAESSCTPTRAASRVHREPVPGRLRPAFDHPVDGQGRVGAGQRGHRVVALDPRVRAARPGALRHQSRRARSGRRPDRRVQPRPRDPSRGELACPGRIAPGHAGRSHRGSGRVLDHGRSRAPPSG
jgi:hypothetical protein